MIRKIGLIVLIIGLLITLAEGVKVFGGEKLFDIEEIEVSHDESGRVSWWPLIGATMMFLGAGIRLPEPKM